MWLTRIARFIVGRSCVLDLNAMDLLLIIFDIRHWLLRNAWLAIRKVYCFRVATCNLLGGHVILLRISSLIRWVMQVLIGPPYNLLVAVIRISLFVCRIVI